MVYDSHLAQDVTLGVFVALAQNARTLSGHAVLVGWLHRTARNLASNVVRGEVRRRQREQESAAMNGIPSETTDDVWNEIAPQLDAALGNLSDADRDAVLLRYFERKSAREMAGLLGLTEDAAQKRVGRAVERLRGLLAKRGVGVGAGRVAALLSTHAVQAAPLGLVASVSATVSALRGTAIDAETGRAFRFRGRRQAREMPGRKVDRNRPDCRYAKGVGAAEFRGG
jgi:RNA polymerase sigma factor (sigma-70 family)